METISSPAGGGDILTGGNGIDTVSYANATSGVTVRLNTTTAQATGGAGSDTITGVENLTGSAFADSFTGTGGANVLIGGDGNDSFFASSGDDLMIGGSGANRMSGGAGADRFRFDILEDSTLRDQITDFERGIDDLEFARSAFTGLAGYSAGALDAAAFTLGTAATTAAHRLIYDQSTGNLFYDADGNGAGAQVLVATLTTRPMIDAGDFILI